MFWTLDRVLNLTKNRLDQLLDVLSQFKDNYDREAIYSELIQSGYVKEPEIPEGKTRKEVYEKKWGSYIGPLTAFGIASIQENKIAISALAMEYHDGQIAYEDFVRTVMTRWQLPNGGLTGAKADEYIREGIILKPFILTLQVLVALYKNNKFECWIDTYDINSHLLKAKNNSSETVDLIVKKILNDRSRDTGRNVQEFKLDVVFNTFRETGLILKNYIPRYITHLTSYTLNNGKMAEIEELIGDNLNPRFTSEQDFKNKEKWLNYYGGSKINVEKPASNIKGENLILFGSPGTGKSFELDSRYKYNKMRVTFHPEYTYYDFVGSYKPTPVFRETTDIIKDKDGRQLDIGEPLINYQFVPGPFTIALEKALKNKDISYTLIIEEINRANAAAVFGDLFQLLDRNNDGRSTYPVVNPEISSYLRSKGITFRQSDEIVIPNNLNIVATMNPADQGVTVLDSAFKRRWNFEYLPIEFKNVEHKDELVFYKNKNVTWENFVIAINSFLTSPSIKVNEVKLIGPYFMKIGEPSEKKLIASKVLIYLWDDVVRAKRSLFFNPNIQTFSQLVTAYLDGEAIFNFDFITVPLDELLNNMDEE